MDCKGHRLHRRRRNVCGILATRLQTPRHDQYDDRKTAQYDADRNCNGYDETAQHSKSPRVLQSITFRLSIFNVFYAMAHPLYYVLATYDVFFAVPSEGDLK